MTAAQLKMDKAIKEKIATMPKEMADEASSTLNSQKPLFKLKRFLEVEPRTSTKRGTSPFMLTG
jgi:phage regulator Rha-like protein